MQREGARTTAEHEPRTGVVHLRAGGTSVVLDLEAGRLPAIVHWGRDLGAATQSVLDDLAVAARPQRVSGGLDRPGRLTLVPQESDGWLATPGLSGHRTGRGFTTALATRSVRVDDQAVTVLAADDDAGIEVEIDLALTQHGVLRSRIRLTNVGDDAYTLDDLHVTLPVPDDADELLDTTGHHLRERAPQRRALTVGAHVRESRRGRPGADASLLLAAGVAGFAFEHGTVHAVHVAWSGNHRMLAERTVTGEALLAAGELLLPGEMVLESGSAYETPWIVASWGDGLTELSGRIHDDLRARPHHPRRPRPVTLNTWEAVYFDHDLDRLTTLADRAAAIGVERFVLDDGWFLGRRDDTAGLGDWLVDPTVWPEGLDPLVRRVRELGMEFGLWVEPEMVNPDSDLAREHPDWMLHGRDDLPLEARQQQVLDLSNVDAWQHVRDRLDALLREHDIAYLKWDHNRDLLEAGDGPGGRARVHENVAALYALLDDLQARHPGLEIESCASGGARVDLGILERTQRVWTSDTLDPLERLQIQRYTGLVVPPELLGAHLTSPTVHSTDRTVSLELSAGVALLGHLGIEWDLTLLDEHALARIADWIALWRSHRAMLATGRVVHADLADPSVDVRGVVAADGSQALVTITQIATSRSHPGARVRIPGLDPARTYRIATLTPDETVRTPGQSRLEWAQGVTLSGIALESAGLRAPALFPQQLALLHLEAID